MKTRLFDDRNEGPISPLIDVVMNGMAALFIILMVYMFVFPPCSKPEPLRFLKGVEPPPVFSQASYVFTPPVAGGSGRRRFTLSGDLPPGLQFDPDTGTVFGVADAVTAVVEFPIRMVVRGSRSEDTQDYRLSLFSVAVPLDSSAFGIVRQSPNLPVGRVGEDYEAVLGSRGGAPRLEWRIRAGRLPLGLEGRGGSIAGVPQQAGSFDLQVELAYAAGSFIDRGQRHSWQGGMTHRNFHLEVLDRLQPVLAPPLGRVGEPYMASLTADLLPDEHVLWTRRIPGVEPLSDGRTLSGVPVEAGIFEVSFRVERGSTVVAEGSGQANILPRRPDPRALSTLVSVGLGEEVDSALSYRGLREPVQVRFLTELPGGLRNEGLALRGKPQVVGAFRLPFEAVDAAGVARRGMVDLRVRPRDMPLKIGAPDNLDLVVGHPIELQLSANGGLGTYQWSSSGRLVDGLELESTGVLAGVLSAAGAWQAQVTVRDPVGGESASRSIAIRAFHPESTQPHWRTTVIPHAIVGSPFEFHFPVQGGVGEFSFRTEGELPAGLYFTEDGIQGTPSSASSSEITVRVSDEPGQKAPPARFEVITERLDAASSGPQRPEQAPDPGRHDRPPANLVDNLLPPWTYLAAAFSIAASLFLAFRLGKRRGRQAESKSASPSSDRR